MYIRYTCCATSDHLVHAFCTDELCSTRVSIKSSPHYTFVENILVEGKARNKHRPVNERKSSYISSSFLHSFLPLGLNHGNIVERVINISPSIILSSRSFTYQYCPLPVRSWFVQSNFNGSNTLGAMKICSRQGKFELMSVNQSAR